MVSMKNTLLYYLNNIDTQNQRVSYQMSTGEILDKGSDDSVLYSQVLNIDENIRKYQGLNENVTDALSIANQADKTMSEMKSSLETIQTEALKALNGTVSATDKQTIALSVEGYMQNIMILANESIDGQYLFAGSDASVEPFTLNSDGSVSYNGDNQNRTVAVENSIYREYTITGEELFDYDVREDGETGDTLNFSYSINGGAATNISVPFNTDEATTLNDLATAITAGGTATASVDADGRLSIQANNTSDTITSSLTFDDVSSSTTNNAKIAASDSDTITYELEDIFSKDSNLFDDLNVVINLLNGKSTDGSTTITEEQSDTLLREYLSNIEAAYDNLNVKHSQLGSKADVLEASQDRITSKITHFQTLYSETNGADLADLALQSSELEIMYSSIYSTISKMNNMSLVDYVN